MAKQHTKPCHDCPFTKKAEPGETGGSHPSVYIAQTILPYWIPCHCCIDYDDPNWKTNYETPQCVGHAMMRANTGVADRMPDQLLRAEPTEDAQVFDSLYQMYAYHVGITEEEAIEFLTSDNQITQIAMEEFSKLTRTMMTPEEFAKLMRGDSKE